MNTMTFLEILVLLVLVVGLGGLFAYAATRNHSTLQDEEPQQFVPYTEEEKENIKLAEELYNKDLRLETSQPVTQVEVEDINVVEPEFVSKETKKPKLESPIEKPKKKRKPRPNTKK
jgi:outer membrane biosynthesis protein TonB